MSKEICISSTPHETRLAIVEDDQLTEIYYERENEYTLAGSIYKGRVTRVLPGMQSAFVDVGLERDAFLYVTDFLEEQEDSAEFEQVRSGGGQNARTQEPRVSQESRGSQEPRGGSEEPRGSQEQRDGQESRGGRESRDSQESRGRREPRGGQEQRRREGRPSSAEARPAEVETRLAPAAEQPQPEQDGAQGGEEFEQGTRKWRGRRGRRRGFRPRDGAAQPQADAGQNGNEAEDATEDVSSPVMEVKAPAAAVRQTSRRGEMEALAPAPGQAAASAPALVLPGESLSKYGQVPAEREHSAREDKPVAKAPASTSRPSTLIEQPLAWDGVSNLLPGESMSRYRKDAQNTAQDLRGEATQTASASYPAETAEQHTSELSTEAASFPGGPQADASWGAPQEIADEEASSVARDIDQVFPPAHAEAQDSADVFASQAEFAPPSAHEEGEWRATDATASSTPAARLEHEGAHDVSPATLGSQEMSKEIDAASGIDEAGEPAAEETEFEPENAAVSYRIDPAARSEFRLTAEFEEDTKQSSAEATSSNPATMHAAHPVEDAPEEDFIETAPPTTLDVEPELPEPDLASDRGPWEAGIDQSEAEPASASSPQFGAHPGSEVEASPSSLDDVRAFTPGDGFVEEEEIDEEEYDFTPIYAHDDEHDYQDLEEETLERAAGAPELGDLIREAQIERQVNVAVPGEDEAEDEFDEADEEDGFEEGPAVTTEEAPAQTRREPRTQQDRGRGGRHRQGRGGRNGGGGGHRRQSAQTTDLPIISELLKQGQEILVQIAKEPIAKKGARITSHIALPGRFLVFMPTVNHVGVSRKIWSDEERQRLKRILISEKGQTSGGFIVRTAADGASEEELRADLRFLISLWNEIKQRSDAAKAPALIYHDLNLVERILRDQVSDNFSTIWVDSETEYERIVRFLNRFQPQLVRRVKLYSKETPLFEQFGIQDEITKALKSKVWLKSGGSIVINQTEALVAIDINTGKYVGKTARLEDTILKTNLDAIPEIVRQIRLRDLGGIIVIDFIDMDERKNRHKVMQALEDALKADRAPSKVLQFNDFGLVAITRKRVKQSLERTLSTQCEVCAGTGMVKSPTTVCNEIYSEMRKMQKHLEKHDVLLRVNPEVVKTLKANNGRWLNELEEMTGRTMIVKSDPALHPEQFDIH